MNNTTETHQPQQNTSPFLPSSHMNSDAYPGSSSDAAPMRKTHRSETWSTFSPPILPSPTYDWQQNSIPPPTNQDFAITSDFRTSTYGGISRANTFPPPYPTSYDSNANVHVHEPEWYTPRNADYGYRESQYPTPQYDHGSQHPGITYYSQPPQAWEDSDNEEEHNDFQGSPPPEHEPGYPYAIQDFWTNPQPQSNFVPLAEDWLVLPPQWLMS